MNSKNSMTWTSWVNAVAGLWLIISPFIIGYATAQALWNDIIVGLAVGVVSLVRALSKNMSSTRWIVWLNSILGIWLIIAPFVLVFGMAIEGWNSVIMGIIVAILGLLGVSTKTVNPATV